jgi:hypothetical protein
VVTSQSYWAHGGGVQSAWGSNNSSTSLGGWSSWVRKESLGLVRPGRWQILERNCSVIGVNWSWRTEESDCQAGRVNSCVSCTETTSVAVGLLIVFLATVSLEFAVERFLATCARETLINGWLIP